jgi:AcrR family transcriptional regulator
MESRPVKHNPLSHNLNGQRLGRKGRDTRDRIIAATQALLAGPQSTPITLSAVAREVSLGMTSLYSYFSDLTELLLAVLDPVTMQAEDAYLAQLRMRWPDDALYENCLAFITAFHGFWDSNARLLHLRNTMADRQDERMAQHRVAAATPVIVLFVEQTGHDPAMIRSPAFGMATVLYAGIERVVNIATDAEMQALLRGNFSLNIKHYLQSEARLLELGIRDYRATA